MDKQMIEELSWIIQNDCAEYCNAKHCEFYNDRTFKKVYDKRLECESIKRAKTIYNAGYRHQNETAQEIWDDCIDRIMRGCGDDKEFWVIEVLVKTFKKYGVGFEEEQL